MTSSSIYLDNAATSFPKADAVYEAVDSWQRNSGAAFGRGIRGADQADSVVEHCRHQLAQLIAADDHRSIALTFSATDGLNLLLRGILRPGQHVVTTMLEHNSVLRPLEQLRTLLPITVEYVPFDVQTGCIVPDTFAEALTRQKPDLVVLNAMSNVTGTVQPIRELLEAAQQTGARTLLDVSQIIGHLPIDVNDMGIDLLAAPGHKGLGGPQGTGFVYVAPALHEQMISVRCGGTGTSSESLQQPNHMPALLESGNLNMPGLAGLDAALSWRGTDDFAEHTLRHHQINEMLHQGLAEIPCVITYCGTNPRAVSGVASFNIEGADPHDVATILSQSFGVQSRAGLHCAPLVHQTLGTDIEGGTVRLSTGLFNTQQEIDQALEAIASVAAAL